MTPTLELLLTRARARNTECPLCEGPLFDRNEERTGVCTPCDRELLG